MGWLQGKGWVPKRVGHTGAEGLGSVVWSAEVERLDVIRAGLVVV